MSSLLVAVKTHFLYPEEHATCQEALVRLHNELQSLLETDGELLVQVKQNRLICHEQVLLTEAAEEGGISFLLFRDGIRWFRLEQGIDLWEIAQFVRILDQYRYLPQESDGDIATALWEAQLPHLSYEVIDPLLTQGEETESPGLEGPQPQTAEESLGPAGIPPAEMTGEKAVDGIACQPLLFPNLDWSSLQLSAQEALLLQEMVSQEEGRDLTREILDMLTDILRLPTDDEFFGMVLDYLEETLRDILVRRDLNSAVVLVNRLNQVGEMCRGEQGWALAAIDGFFRRVSKPEFLSVLGELWAAVDESDLERLKSLLLSLTPEAVYTLAPLLPTLESPGIVRSLTEIVRTLARRDPTPLTRLIQGGEEDLLTWIAWLLGTLEDERTVGMLLELLRHRSAKVRREAVKAVISRQLWIPQDLFPLVEDENRFIRQSVLRYLGSRRCVTAEQLFLDYLQKRKSAEQGAAHLFGCFRTLGRCGTSRSIPFLRETLLETGWLSRVRRSFRRKAAAIALRQLDLEEAREILEAAAHSLNAGVRQAVGAILKRHDDAGEA